MNIRLANEADLGLIMELTAELASFEELSEEFVASPEQFQEALFGSEAVVRVTLATDELGTVVGHALWFPTFSTFLGASGICLEDLFVRPAARHQGYATQLLHDLRARTNGRVEWEVLDWNSSASAFYEGLGAEPHRGWTKFRWLPS
ncbi:MAG: GNAT family N-acetyltransferase [Actinobacteria bacterium]|nr:GNAT family N-acetyltransferase [Actinomycetota bacterium]